MFSIKDIFGDTSHIYKEEDKIMFECENAEMAWNIDQAKRIANEIIRLTEEA
ncbi:hypothetical protein [Bacillus albus]|uniref:hypothetical protein n=1 Tax=Bacillus albus TaxID=2026189 RepID=UPI0013EB6B2E|nr:hypothetical protein [Bacillus albus]